MEFKFFTFLVGMAVCSIAYSQSTATTIKPATTTTTPGSFTNCDDKCNNGYVYLIFSPKIIQKTRTDIFSTNDPLLSRNLYASSQDGVSYNFFLSQNTSSGSFNVQLTPIIYRKSLDQSFVMLVNKTSICLLFEKYCNIDCFATPDFVTMSFKFYSVGSHMKIRSNIQVTDDKLTAYGKSDSCKKEIYSSPDIGYMETLKNKIATLYDTTFETFKFFGFLGSSGYGENMKNDEVFLNEFCLQQWKTYDFKKEIYLNVSARNDTFFQYATMFQIKFYASSYNYFIFRYSSSFDYMFGFDVFGLNGEYELTEVLDFRRNSSNENFDQWFIKSDKYGNFYLILQFNDNSYSIYECFYNGCFYTYLKRIYMYKINSRPPYNTLDTSVIETYSRILSFTYDQTNDDFYLIFKNNFFVFDSQSFDINRNESLLLGDMGLGVGKPFQHNGHHLYFTDSNTIQKFDTKSNELNSRIVATPNYTSDPFTLVNECLFVTFHSAMEYYGSGMTYTWSNVLNFLHIDGKQSYSLKTKFNSSSYYYYSGFINITTVDSKIYMYNLETGKVLLIDYLG